MEKKVKGFEELLREKDEQIQSLNEIGAQYQELRGKQLLQVIKFGKMKDSDSLQLTTTGSNSSTNHHHSEPDEI